MKTQFFAYVVMPTFLVLTLGLLCNSNSIMINGGVITFTLAIIIFVETIMYKRVPTAQKIADYQKVLNEMDRNAKIKYNLDWKHDAMEEIMKERIQTKSFTLIFSGMFLAFVLIGLIFLHRPSFDNIAVSCLGGVLLICYGLIKIAESKRFALTVLLFVFVVGTLMMVLFDKLMTASPYSYFYLCGLILVLGIFTFIPQVKKFIKNHQI